MNDPPPRKRKGVDRAATRPTPETDLFLHKKRKKSRGKYRLHAKGVNPLSPVADARASERGTGDADQLTEAEQKFLELCLERTGEELPPDIHAQRLRYRGLLIEQSHRIAAALESQGIRAYGDSKLTLVGLCSGEKQEIPDFRNIVFIPAIAQRKRNELLKHLEYFIQQYPFSRMWVFTSGVRVELDGVRSRVQEMHRRVSKLNFENFMKGAGASIVFRSTELGEMKRSQKGEPTFHVHAHVIIHLKKKLSKERWSELLSKVQAWWVHSFKEAKRIHGVRETCKYVVKPNDLESLSPEELAELYRQTFRLHLVQALGLLKAQRKLICDDRKKLVRRSQKAGGGWEIVDSWEPKRPKSSKATDDARQEYPDGPEDWILCTLPPSFAVSNRAEPIAVVLNYNGTRLNQNRKFKAIRTACAEKFKERPESIGE